MGEACVSGAAKKGVWTSIKHFAVNEQEINRNNNGASSWVNEQALREIYLRPFEYTVKNSTVTIKYISDENGTVSEREMNGCIGVMSSFNRIGAVWAGGSAPLLQSVLRGEWGFKGLVISDFNLYGYMHPDQGIAAGTDLMLSFESMKSLADTSSATAVSNFREAAHNILFTVAHTNAMNGIAPGTIISYTKSPWELGLFAADIAIGVLFCIAVAWFIIRIRKYSEVNQL
jgi:beta-glucosidase